MQLEVLKKYTDTISNKAIRFNVGKDKHLIYDELAFVVDEILNPYTGVELINNNMTSLSDVMSLVEKLYKFNDAGLLVLINDETSIYLGRRGIDDGVQVVSFLYKLDRTDANGIDYDKFASMIFTDSDIKEYPLSLDNMYLFPMNKYIFEALLAYNRYKVAGKEPYKKFKLKCKNGKIRDIVAPESDIKSVLRKINTILQNTYDKRNESFQVGYKKGKSILSNADIHKEMKYCFNIDIHSFFPSCKRDLVSKYISFLFPDYMEDLKEEFLDLILVDDALFIGSPVSGTIANAIISSAVKYINNMCRRHNIKFSVYADDMSFSSDKFLTKEFIVNMFNEAFKKYGLDDYFTLSEKKCKGGTGTRKRVTGLHFNDNNQVVPNRKHYNNIRSGLFHLRYGDFKWDYNKFKGILEFALYNDQSEKTKKLLKKYKEELIKYKYIREDRLNEIIGE